MKRLLKEHNLTHLHQYFDLIVIAYIQGNESKLRDRFKVLKRREKKEFINLTLRGAYENRLQTKYTNEIIELLK